jgi:hypothetical protein
VKFTQIFRRPATYQGAGGRIRTDDQLITNQSLSLRAGISGATFWQKSFTAGTKLDYDVIFYLNGNRPADDRVTSLSANGHHRAGCLEYAEPNAISNAVGLQAFTRFFNSLF